LIPRSNFSSFSSRITIFVFLLDYIFTGNAFDYLMKNLSVVANSNFD